MRELQKIFAKKKTENGDNSYRTTGNRMIDLLFMTQFFRNHLNRVPHIGNSEKEKLFAKFIRDPRYGIGERDLGRVLMSQANVSPMEVLECGRADDLIYMSIKSGNNKYINHFIELLKSGDYNIKKWSPRMTSGNKSRQIAKYIRKKLKLTEKEYRQLIKCDTTEMRVCHHTPVKDYSQVPSLAFLKHKNTFYKQDNERFISFMKEVNSGNKTIKTSTTTPYDIFKKCVQCSSWSRDTKVDKDADVLFKSLPQVNLGSILPIIDNSGSMYDTADSQGKAKAIGHYVAKNSTYMPNHVITFSSNPRLLELGNTYEQDMKILTSYDDCSNTDFGKVMKLLGQLEKDVPDYLLVLSDMEFDYGSSLSKTKTMKMFKEKGIKTRIIWWNFNTRNTTSPEMDYEGNIFISGYSPQLLKFLESGFNAEQFLDKLLEEYQKKIANK